MLLDLEVEDPGVGEAARANLVLCKINLLQDGGSDGGNRTPAMWPLCWI